MKKFLAAFAALLLATAAIASPVTRRISRNTDFSESLVTTDDSAHDIAIVAVPVGHVYGVKFDVVAKDIRAGDSDVLKGLEGRNCTFEADNQGGETGVTVDSTGPCGALHGSLGSSSVNAAAGTGVVKITVTGPANETIFWKVVVHIVPITTATLPSTTTTTLPD